MANNHTTLTGLFTAIANAIRAKTGSTDSIVADGFPDAVGSIVTLKEGSSDATATAAQILSGYTAYANGLKVIGNMATGTNVSSWGLSAFSKEQSGQSISVQLDTSSTFIVICNSVGSDYSTSYGEHADAQASVFLVHEGKIVFGIDQEARHYRNSTSRTYKRLSNDITANATISSSGLFTFEQNTPDYEEVTCYAYSVYKLV